MADTAVIETVGSLSTEKVTYRTYLKGEGDKQTVKVQAEAQAKDSKTGVAKNWQALEDDGFTVGTENEFIRYTIKSEDGFKALVPDETQRIYIAQAGLNYLQNAKANGLMTAVDESNPEHPPLYSNATIDLRDAINEPPTRKSLTDLEKLEKTLAALGLDAKAKGELLRQLAAGLDASDES